MNFFVEKNIRVIIFSSSIILIGLLSLLFSAIFIYSKAKSYDEELSKIEEVLTAQQKELLKSSVYLQVQRIDYVREQIENRLKETLKGKVHDAVTIASNLYLKNKDLKSELEIRNLIREALRPIRFYEDRGYIFIYSLDGETILNPPGADKEGKNAYEIYKGKQLQAITGLEHVVRSQGEGFYDYEWLKPKDNIKGLFKKISYVQHFAPYNWYIGAGEYYENFEEMVKKEILREIEEAMDPMIPDYFFIYDLHDINGGDNFATMLLNPNKPQLVGKKLSDTFTDSKGRAFRGQFLKDIREAGESFVTYWYKKPNQKDPGRKLSYFRLYPEWNWIVARGVYFDVLDKIIEEKKELVVRTMKKEQLLLFSFVCLSIASVIVVAHFFTLGINGIIEQYKEKQKEHLEDLARMNRILEKKATTDTLTGLYNRFYFNTKLEDELTRYKRYKSPFCLIVFDVDDFKMINDTLGHVSGDYVLREIAVLVAYEIRQSDIFARWGGEEFVILTVENDLKATVKLAEKLRRSIEKHSFSIDMNVTCSFGVTEYMADEGAKELIDRTDQALYAAKRDGKNKVKTA